MRIAAVVLAGGLATRLGGGDKPLRLLSGEPILAHVLRRLSSQVEAIALSANGDPTRFAAFGLPVLADNRLGSGPLSGVLAGLEWACSEPGFDRLLTVAGDTPFLPADLAARLALAGSKNSSIAMAASAGRKHPVFALWPPAAATGLRRFMAEGATLSVLGFIEQNPNRCVDFPFLDYGIDPFFNINTAADLARAEILAQRLGK